ncbi:SpvB/TcaC N-terminal domain-containing protein [Crocosphaera sp.]|uniref:SpvB/TcaC N-terminal domain-containing protein n=1 Tax=Crocosphaera sp. TaxID=2729996 RepID=UPI002619B187|nr:SpvB/TcaC N-terminal domain-containing protein [Crocosphaera sp.]MDJ0581480.1 SpvB/TcaC N-terminal domain-containing protein [Crocosphaera sp.]
MLTPSTQKTNDSRADYSSEFVTVPPALSLPKGGGAIKGMGEKFTANPITGTGSMSVPIATSPGRSGFGPQLSLSYDSGASNSNFGFGWSLSIPSITRKTDKGLPRYFDAEETDVFILSGGEDIVPVLVQDELGKWRKETLAPRNLNGTSYCIQRYRPRTEGLFARIECWTNLESGETHWRSLSKDNVTTLYGKTAESRIVDPNDATRIFSWLICESYDDKGNVISYEYKSENSEGIDTTQVHERNRNDNIRSANRYLKRIKYGNQTPRQSHEDLSLQTDWMFETVFDYGEHDLENPTPNDIGIWSVRNDPFSSYRAGFEVRTYRLCQRVLMFHHFPEEEEVRQNCLVRSTNFNYSYEENLTDVRNPIYSKLISVSQIGYKRNSEGGYIHKSLPPLEFTYSESEIDETVRDIDLESLENLPQGLDGTNYQWVDLDGEGLSGILTEQGDSWFYKRNLSPISKVQEDAQNTITVKFAPIELITSKPATALADNAQFMDLAGDGQLDLVTLRSLTPGFYERTTTEGWKPFIPFQSLPVLDWNNPNLKFIDLNGDGHSDILITENNCFVWHASLAEDGFGTAERSPQPWDEEKGPRVVFADSTQSIYLADFSGDGLTDIVRIRNGEVCYWPNFGYGQFGAKVTMDNSPWFDTPDIFNQRRIILADIDGSGTTDILYLSAEGVQVYFNQSGNSWSTKQILRSFPTIDNVASVTAIDLLGNGTTCLVWSSPLPGKGRSVMRYIDLIGGQKPHLLIKTINNLGAETTVEYAPSTKFYLQDSLAGKPWITKLPFPVHVVEKVTIFDKWRQTHFTSTYSYHHGYFDGIEREFRGFGRVEQTDVEDFGTFTTGNISSPYIDDDQTLYQPPVKTITWFHTGAFLDREQILSQFADEYFPHWFEELNPHETNILGDFQENSLPEPDLMDENLNTEEWREALRACKGMMLRQEVYELDVDALKQGEERKVKLFSTAFHNCHIQRLQAHGENRHAVFLVTESEAITYHYELDLTTDILEPDPRISHTLNLQIDEYGNVLESVAVAYPRIKQYQNETLPEGTEGLINQVQQERHLVYTENRFTNDVDDPQHPDRYRLRVPCEVKTYELTGISPQDGFYYTLLELQQADIANDEMVEEIAYHEFPDRTTPQKRRVEWVRMLYFSDDLETPLPWGELNYLGLPYETYKLALTNDLLNAIFNSEHLTTEVHGNLDNADLSGYLSGVTLAERFPDMDTTGQYWIRSGVAGFAPDAAEHYYLPERYTDPFGQTTTLAYDSRDLYIESSTDPIGNTTQVTQFDFRVLTPSEMRDINGNLSQVYFDAFGLPTAMAIMGKGNQADSLNSFDDELANPTSAQLNAFFAENAYNENQARIWLENATARYVYYFGEQENDDGRTTWGEHPASACSILREQHSNEDSPIQVGFEYSDGMGTVLVKKVQAEPEIPNGPLRWIATGKTILNNKGNPVKQYEPYFSQNELGEPDHRFEEPQEIGVTPILYYDAVGRQVQTEMPNGTYSRVAFSPWFMATYDGNDTVLEANNAWYERYLSGEPEQRRAARLAEIHANTPAVTHLDSLGREVVAIAHNKWRREDVDFEEKYVTFTKLDIEGKPLWIRDARGNRVMEYINSPGAETGFVSCYDIAGNLLFEHSMDGGDRWMLMDATGQPFYAWDENERGMETDSSVLERRRFQTIYDALRRPVEQQLQIDEGSPVIIERLIYGEGQTDDLNLNLRGQVYQHYDSSGLVTNQGFDFKGNLLVVTRQLVNDYKAQAIDWSGNSPTNNLESEVFTVRTEYDALNRPTLLTSPDQSVTRPVYNEANLLEQMYVRLRGAATETVFVENIDYDAKGQRTLIEYGNGVRTTYTYDPETFRLVRLLTTRTSDNARLQDLKYTYDPVGNITEIRDDAQQTVYFDNTQILPHNNYTYDALYRLIRAQGREHAVQNNLQRDATEFNPILGIPFPNSPEALQQYVEEYTYDRVGNILSMRHTGGAFERWNRRYQYAEDSNRLLATSRPDDAEQFANYTYDTHGNMTTMPHLPLMQWDYQDRLKATSRQIVNNGTPETTYYVYDGSGQRVRKVTERQTTGGISTRKNERIYLGGFEIYREYGGDGETVTLERETLHVMDNQQRIALVETKTAEVSEGVASPTDLNVPVIRYQLNNHLGSASVELDSGGAVISYEEYHPYGTTAYQAMRNGAEVSFKRYRYTGKERDEESDLYYHGARYYAPWLARWASADPSDLEDGLNLFNYVRNNPIILRDPNGKLSWGTVFGIAAAVVVGTVVTVATAGLAAPLLGAAAASVIGGVVGGAAGGAAAQIVEDLVDRGKVDWGNVGVSALIGGVTGGVFSGAGAAISRGLSTQAGRALSSKIINSNVGQVVARGIYRIASSSIGRGVRAAGDLARRGIERPAQRAGESLGRRLGGKFAERSARHQTEREAAEGVLSDVGADVTSGKVRASVRGELEGDQVAAVTKSGERGVIRTPEGRTIANTPNPTTVPLTPRPFDSNPRTVDAEFKLLGFTLLSTGSNPKIAGRLFIGANRAFCPSCQGAMSQFRVLRPNIDLLNVRRSFSSSGAVGGNSPRLVQPDSDDQLSPSGSMLQLQFSF